MFKSLKKVIIGVLAACLMLTSVAFAAESPTGSGKKASDPKVITKTTVSKVDNVKYVELTKVTKIKANAVQSKTTSLVISGKKKVTVAKNAFAKANKKLKITVYKNKVSFNKKAFGKANTKNMTIQVKGLKKTSKAYKSYVKKLRASGFKGKIKTVK